MIRYPDTAPLPIVGWACFEYVGYGYLPGRRFRAVVARYVIPCGRGPKWNEIRPLSRHKGSAYVK